MKCHIAKDLLPNYIDSLNSEETNIELKSHLDDCADCRIVYEKMTAEITKNVQTTDRNVDFFKKIRLKILRRDVIVAFALCLLLVSGLLMFTFNYEIPIPFDSHRMRAEVIPFAVTISEDGSSSWYFADEEMPSVYESVMDGLVLAHNGFSYISMSADSREINRNGDTVRVVYYCYFKTPWSSMFYDYDLVSYSSMMSSSQIYGPSYGSIDYKPQMIEIYYLPITNFNRIEKLSDEDYDAKRVNCTLVWSGVI